MSPAADPVRKSKALPADVRAALAAAVKSAGSQADVARVLGLSGTVVSQCLADKYPGDVDKVALRIRGQYMHAEVLCPVLGTISTKLCLDEQRRPLRFTNPLRVALARACRTCQHRSAGSACSDGKEGD